MHPVYLAYAYLHCIYNGSLHSFCFYEKNYILKKVSELHKPRKYYWQLSVSLAKRVHDVRCPDLSLHPDLYIL